MKESGKTYAIVPAAGDGTRLGSEGSKVLLKITKDRLVLEKVLDALVHAEIFDGVVIAVRDSDREAISKIASNYQKQIPIDVISGGKSRQQSVYRALQHVEGQASRVLVHDAARPLCTPHDMRLVYEAIQGAGAAILAEPVKSTLKRVDPKSFAVLETISRESLWLAQTPQGFLFDLLYRAHAKALEDDYEGTDDSELVERLGKTVSIVKSSASNIKLTTAEDLTLVRSVANTKYVAKK